MQQSIECTRKIKGGTCSKSLCLKGNHNRLKEEIDGEKERKIGQDLLHLPPIDPVARLAPR